MMKHWFLPSLVTALVAAAPPSLAQGHEVRFFRPVAPGDRLEIHAEGQDQSSTETTLDGQAQPRQERSFQAIVDATCEVQEVDRDGAATKVAFTINQLTVTTPEGEQTPIPAGAVIAAERGADGQVAYSVNGNTLTGPIAALLDLLLGMPGGDQEDERFFGTTDLRNAGDTWPINTDAVIAEFSRRGGTVLPENVSGSATLVRTIDHEGVSCLELKGSIETKDAQPPRDSLPPGVRLESSRMTAEFTGFFPVDETLPVMRTEVKSTQESMLKGRVGENLAQLEAKSVASRQVIRTIKRLP